MYIYLVASAWLETDLKSNAFDCSHFRPEGHPTTGHLAELWLMRDISLVHPGVDSLIPLAVFDNLNMDNGISANTLSSHRSKSAEATGFDCGYFGGTGACCYYLSFAWTGQLALMASFGQSLLRGLSQRWPLPSFNLVLDWLHWFLRQWQQQV